MQVERIAAGDGLARVRRMLADPGEGPALEGPSLEMTGLMARELPSVAGAEAIEGGAIAPRAVDGDPIPGFHGFLDGTQRSEVARYVGPIPIVHGTLAAVVRERRDRRLSTWQREVRRELFAPRKLLPAEWAARLDALPIAQVDTSPDEGDALAGHPLALLERAVHAVQRVRERTERDLARRWCAERGEPLYVDGSIAGDATLSGATQVVGVIKSHRVVYGGAAGVAVACALDVGERSTVMRIDSSHPNRHPVASWYLRLRSPARHDPLWGLVRVEIGTPHLSGDVGRRADLVSRWILAELAPIALPDSRWHTMIYPIRDCEEYLRAIC